ncbi:Phosphatidylcholine-hydrolyzing phospholipase C (EC 3.1.4.3) [Azospirillum doebereinerae]
MPQARNIGTPGGPHVRFEGGEHTAIGDSITLYFSGNDPGTPAWQVPLSLPNGLALTYGQIVALGGDFYGIPARPISDGTTPEDRAARFTDAFNSLAYLPASKDEATQILAVMKIEIDAANQALANGEEPHEAYDRLGDTLSGKWNRITGGGGPISDFFPLGRYLKLAAVNWDHFGTWAVLAYTAGHTMALQQALRARAGGGRAALELAYAMNAFADHYLSDLFSGGHLRTPRKQLYDTVTPSDIGSLLSRYMHDEDCKFGLNVTSAAEFSWRAYGDKRYFDTMDVANRNQVDATVQASADEIFETFSTGTAPAPADFGALLRIANLQSVQDRRNTQNYSPLFAADGATVLRRNDVNNLNDRSWTASWWGWSTYLLLQKYNPNTPTGYLTPPTGAPAIVLNGWQTRTPIPPNWVDGNTVRYAFSRVNGQNESYTGPWSPYTELRGAYLPTLTVPVDPTGGATARNIFRQFGNGQPELIGTIPDNTTTSYIDNQP